MRYILMIAVLLSAGMASLTAGEIYRCQGDNGETIFADEPCGADAARVEVQTQPSASTNSETSGEPSSGGAADPNDDRDRSSQSDPESADGKTASAAKAEDNSANPCLKTSGNNDILRAGTTAARIREACGAPDEVTTANDVFDRTLHYDSGERGVEIFIRDGKAVGHRTL